ncbi:MAG TPA: DUF4294 domain-containing protein [Bacteroidales bacterium]|jgi:hypothetical protein|nr:DUF4294 domain-containing protein [Bacteroidales bacterium]
MIRKFITGLLLFLPGFLFAQSILNPRDAEGVHCSAIIIDNDTVPVIYLDNVYIWGKMSFRNSAEARRWNRLVYNVKKTWPYARLAGLKFEEYSKKIVAVDNERIRKTMMKQAENELQDQFGEELKALTFTQGKILLKLVDRQTGNCSYDIVKDFRGRFQAFFWQSFARIFGYNLKVKYDPLHEDADIERIVLMIENGTI